MIQAKVRSTVSHVAPLVRATMANAAADYHEALHPWHASDDLERDVGLVPGPFDEASGIAAVREDMLDKWKAGAGSLQHALRTVTILNVGGMDTDGQQAAVRVGQNVALAPVDLLGPVVALASPF
jgi:hypothetical protein